MTSFVELIKASLYSQVVVGDLFPRLYISQGAHLQIIVINRIGRVAVIDKSELAANLYAIVLVQPENMLAVARGGDAIDDTDDVTGFYLTPGKQALAVDRAIVYVDQ
jgi:hypothetical protein